MPTSKYLLCFSLIIASLILQPAEAKTPPTQAVYDANMLPTNYEVYSNGTSVINRPASGYWPVLLPTYNQYTGNNPGCYIACYSRNSMGFPSTGYSIGSGMYVKGQVRVSGLYVGRKCVPDNPTVQRTPPVNEDLSKDPYYINLCNTLVPTCSNGMGTCGGGSTSCWPGADTGGWYGIQP